MCAPSSGSSHILKDLVESQGDLTLASKGSVQLLTGSWLSQRASRPQVSRIRRRPELPFAPASLVASRRR